MPNFLSIFIIFLALISVIEASYFQPPFAAYQVFLWPNDTTTLRSQVNTPYTFVFTLPIAYQLSYKRSLALSGLNFDNSYLINFTAIIVSNGSTESIQINILKQFTIYQLTYYVIVVSTPEFGVWSLVKKYQTIRLNASNGYSDQQQKFCNLPFSISKPADFRFSPFLIDYAASTDNAAIKIYVEVKSLSVSIPNCINVSFSRDGYNSNRRITDVTFNVVVINKTYLSGWKIYNNQSTMDIYLNNGGSYSLFSAKPINFGILSSYLLTTDINYKCVIGVSLLKLHPTVQNYFDFDARYTPFGNFQVYLQANKTESLYNFYVTYQIFCLENCPNLPYDTSTGICGCLQPHCLACSNQYCSKCQNNYIAVNGSCFPCSYIYNQCVSCSNNTCTDCSAQFTWNSSISSCVNCSTLFSYCYSCSLTSCVVCQHGFILQGSKCICMSGSIINGYCNEVVGCVAQITKGDGTMACTACNLSTYQINPINNECLCLNGVKAKGYCEVIAGCVTPYLAADRTLRCQFCNAVANFVTQPRQNQCDCLPKYELKGSVCVQICGDGFMMIPNKRVCDDGNKVSGDGCSSTCFVQPYYQCYNGSSLSASFCIYYGKPPVATVKSIRRNEELNEGIFTFSFNPSLPALNKLNFSDNTLFICISEYSISNIEFTNGLLQVKVVYTKDLEGASCNLSVTFDQSLIKSPKTKTQLVFTAIYENIKLVISHELEKAKKFKVILQILSLISLGLFLVSFGHRMIGAELIVSCQLIYLGCSMFGRPSFLYNSFNSFDKVAVTYRIFDEPVFKNILYSFTSVAEKSKQFLFNTLLIKIVLASLSFCYILLKVYNYFKQSCASQNTNQVQRESGKLHHIIKLFYDCLLFPFTYAFMIVIFLSVLINSQRIEDSRVENFQINLTILFVMIGVISAVLSAQLLDFLRYKKSKKKLNHPVALSYSLLFAARSTLVVLLLFLISRSELKGSTQFLLVTNFLYLLIVIVKQPYVNKLQNISVILQQSNALLALLFGYISQKIVIDEYTQICVIMFIQILLCICILTTCIRIFYFYYQLITTWLKNTKKYSSGASLQSEGKKMYQNPKDLSGQSKFGYGGDFIKNIEGRNQNLMGMIEGQSPLKEEEKRQLLLLKSKLRKDFRKKANISG